LAAVKKGRRRETRKDNNRTRKGQRGKIRKHVDGSLTPVPGMRGRRKHNPKSGSPNKQKLGGAADKILVGKKKDPKEISGGLPGSGSNGDADEGGWSPQEESEKK